MYIFDDVVIYFTSSWEQMYVISLHSYAGTEEPTR